MEQVVTLSGRGLSPEQVDEIARCKRQVAIADDARRRILEAHHAVERAVSDNAPVYGVTTGLGPRVTTRLDPAADGDPALRTLRERAVAVGQPLPATAVRAAMAARLNGLCTGGSGAAPEVAETLAALLNAGVHPVVPRYGSVGAADLCLLAHVGLVVAGEGEAEVGGRRVSGAEALAAAGITPATLRLKDGLALCSASSVSAGMAALELTRARRQLDWLQSAAALSMEGFRANLSPIDPRVAAARAAPGQEWAARGLRELLAGGSLTEPGAARRLQDPLSFRCASVVHGALHATLDLLQRALEPELNGASDNPLVLAADGEIVPTGNFHTAALATAADAVSIAIAQSAAPSAERVSRLCTPELSGLPANLSPTGSTGFAPLQKVGHSLVAAIRQHAAPHAVHPSVDAGGVEDDGPNTALAVMRLGEQLDLLAGLIAVELVCAAQAVELAQPAPMGAGTEAVHRRVRELAQPLVDARPLTSEIEAVAAMVG
jgi:histidine ammonia-lyase